MGFSRAELRVSGRVLQEGQQGRQKLELCYLRENGTSMQESGAPDAREVEEPVEVRAPRLRLQAVGSVAVPLPSYQTRRAAGLDLSAALPHPLALRPLQRELIPTGLALGLPPGFEGQVRPRSGLALKYGLTVLNAPGTIDEDYRGEVKVLLINLGAEPVTIEPLQRIAQLIVAPVARVRPTWVASLEETQRGSGGYGSTGA